MKDIMRAEEKSVLDNEDGSIADPASSESKHDFLEVEEEEEEESSFSRWILPAALFLMTVFTTLWAGAFQA